MSTTRSAFDTWIAGERADQFSRALQRAGLEVKKRSVRGWN